MILHQRPLRTIYDTLSLTNSTLLLLMIFFGVQKILFPTDDFHFLFHRILTVPSLSHLTSCTPTNSNLFLANSLASAVSEPTLYRLLTFHVPKKCPFSCCAIPPREKLPPRRSERGSSLPPDCFVSRGSISPCEYLLTMFFFHGEALLAPRPTTKLDDHPSSAVRDCLFNIFAVTPHTPLIDTAEKYYFHSLPRLALLFLIPPPKHMLQLLADGHQPTTGRHLTFRSPDRATSDWRKHYVDS